jgi:hypothetical protein
MLIFAGLMLAVAGCCSGENQIAETESASTAPECPTGECCSGISRAALLKQSKPAEQNQQESQ